MYDTKKFTVRLLFILRSCCRNLSCLFCNTVSNNYPCIFSKFERFIEESHILS